MSDLKDSFKHSEHTVPERLARDLEPDEEMRKEGFKDIEASSDQHTIWVEWDGPNDPTCPLNFSKARKWGITLCGTLFVGLVSSSVASYAISQPSMGRAFNSSRQQTVLGVMLFTITYGVAPLILAPFSELWGRRWIYMGSVLGFAIMFIPTALAPNLATMLASRFISGVFASSSIGIVGGTLSDVWTAKDRGFPMAFFSFAAFIAPGIGPVIFGLIEQYKGFRLIFWIHFALTGLLFIALIFLLPETRVPVLLKRKAARVRKEYERQTPPDTIPKLVKIKGVDKEKVHLGKAILSSVIRPLSMLTTELPLIVFTLWISFAWAVLYIFMEALTPTFMSVYGFTISQASFTFANQCIGSTVGLVINYYGNKLYLKNVARRGPEARLYNAFFGAILFPVGCWIYAFTMTSSIHWIVPCTGICILFIGIFLIYLTTFSYLADAYTLYAASALSAQSFVRNIVGAVSPLYTSKLYNNLGQRGGGCLVAGLATFLTLIPFLLYRYGETIRKQSKYYIPSPNVAPIKEREEA